MKRHSFHELSRIPNATQIPPDYLFHEMLRKEKDRLFSGGAYGLIRKSEDAIRRGDLELRNANLEEGNKCSGYCVYTKYFGHTADSKIHPDAHFVGPDSLFDIASITKSIPVALLVYWANTNNLISLSDEVNKYIPELKSIGEKPTIADLLSYRVNLSLDTLKYPYSQYSSEKILELIINSKIETRNSFRYSNYPPILLVFVLERVTGKSFTELVHDILIKPLNLQAIINPKDNERKTVGQSPYVCTENSQNESAPYEGVVHDPLTRASDLLGAAGMFCTVQDLLVIAQLLLEKGSIENINIIRPDLIEKIGLNCIPSSNGPRFGLGFGCWSEFAEGFEGLSYKNTQYENFAKGAFFKTGFTGSIFACFPEIKSCVVVCTNGGRSDPKTGKPIYSVKKSRFLYCAVMQSLLGSAPAEIRNL